MLYVTEMNNLLPSKAATIFQKYSYKYKLHLYEKHQESVLKA